MVTQVTAKYDQKLFLRNFKRISIATLIDKMFSPNSFEQVSLNEAAQHILTWRTRHTLTLIYDVYAFAHTTRLKS